jgi:hypothetical protein
MHKLFVSIAAALSLVSVSAFAGQNELSPERKADTAALRALAKETGNLAGERVELKLNPAVQIVGISAMAGDAQGNFYILHRPMEQKLDADPIVVVDPKGNVLRSFGKGLFNIPHGIRVDAAGNVWTVDANTSIVRKFSNDGKELMKIEVGGIPQPDRAFCGATDVAFGNAGQIYISDGYCNGRVVEYTAGGEKVKEFGTRGTENGQLNNAHGIAMGPDGNIYVADRESGRVQWFTVDGKFLGTKKFGGQLFSVSVARSGDVFVGAQPRDVPFGTDHTIFKFDPKTGNIAGKVMLAAHQLSLGADGSLLGGTRGDKLEFFRPKI